MRVSVSYWYQLKGGISAVLGVNLTLLIVMPILYRHCLWLEWREGNADDIWKSNPLEAV